MSAEIGHFMLWLALGVSVVLGVVPLVGSFAPAGHRRAAWMNTARPLALWLFLLTAVSFAMLVASFLQHDFSVHYVASNSNSELPAYYRVTAVWGGHEGSMLLWLVMMAGWTLAVASFSRTLPLVEVARVLSVMGLLNIGFTLFTLTTSNPFDRLIPAPADGRDLNPLLQDPGMIFHPPMLYMGYVGFSVAFAFAVAALIGGRLDATWARWTRPWTTVAWIFLTLGIALGSWWAYYELGWGGWWFWDPVENASFMPWLVGTALIHSLAVTEKRGAFKSWTVLLAILAFSLSLLGTFLVRSGVLSSVHAFATDPRRGLFILAFLVIVVGISLALYAWRAPRVGLGARFALVSRETFLLANNVLLLVATGAVMLGTLYPLVIDALGLGKLSVGPPYFNAVFIPLMAPLVFLIGVGPMARWKEAALPDMAVRLKWAAGVSVLAALAASWAAGEVKFGASLALGAGFWVLASTVADIVEHVRVPGAGLFSRLAWQRLRQQPRAVVGMWTAHAGVAVFIFGVTMVSAWQVERDVTLAPGQSVEVQGLSFTFRGVAEREGPNFDAVRGTIEVAREGKVFTTLRPEKRVYRVQKNPMTEASIRTRLSGDIYVSLGEPTTQQLDGPWIVRIYLKPFVAWIWGGCVVMALGGLLAASDRRYRAKLARRDVPAGGAVAT